MKLDRILLCCFTFFFLFDILLLTSADAHSLSSNDKSKLCIMVDLTEQRLYLIDNKDNEIVKKYPIAGGKPTTPSPIGTWTIVYKAKWDKGFGTRWMALNVPWGKYGIHGTNQPLTIGGAASLGCIRMYNHDVEDLYNRVDCGTIVTIYGGPYGLYENAFRRLIPGDRGADVYEVQRRMQFLGYYSDTLDGVYGESLKKQVIKYRKDHKLKITHDINKEFYKSIGMYQFE